MLASKVAKAKSIVYEASQLLVHDRYLSGALLDTISILEQVPVEEEFTGVVQIRSELVGSECTIDVATSLMCCDACGSEMQFMGHCKYWCRSCGFLRTCTDTV